LAIRSTSLEETGSPGSGVSAPPGTTASATAALKDTGLVAVIEEDGNWLDRLLGEPQVCSTAPGAGTAVARKTKVTVRVARACS
jgi:beta-lactam-binding protein with PASTA domain